MDKIDKNTLRYLAGLARIEIKKEDEEKLAKDLQKILAYFEELKEADAENIEPMAGGNIFTFNVFREDDESVERQTSNSKLKDAFPEEKDGFLRAPAVFE